MSRKVDENGYITTTTEAKPIEYAPVRHAYWRDTKFSYGECSECGEWTDHYTIARYCVHCGAKMDVVKV